MDRRCIVVCDSGIGGLRLLKKLENAFPSENFVYFADYKNLPYGEKSKDALYNIAEENYKKALAFCPKLIVFACNTLSTNVLPCFERKSVPIIGVYPIAQEGRGVLLCTDGTAKSRYVTELKERFNGLEICALKGFAKEIEDSFKLGKEIDFSFENYLCLNDYDYVSLGCTHYPYAEKYLRKIFKNSCFISGENQTFDKIVFFMTTNDTNDGRGCVSFVGENSDFLKSLYFKGNFII